MNLPLPRSSGRTLNLRIKHFLQFLVMTTWKDQKKLTWIDSWKIHTTCPEWSLDRQPAHFSSMNHFNVPELDMNVKKLSECEIF